ncbi:MAG: hypothetical protein ACE5DX_00425 [Candidatus Dojkabacteria bacterium]
MGKSRIISTNSQDFAEERLNEIRSELGIDFDSVSDYYKIHPKEGTLSIGIDQMRSFKAWACLKPYAATCKLGVIFNGELMTIEAQNSILKLLEEPPQSTYLVIVTSDHHRLLATVKSRCELIASIETRSNEGELPGRSRVEALLQIEELLKIKDRTVRQQKVIGMLTRMLQYYRHSLRRGEDSANSLQQIARIGQTVKMLRGNVSYRLALENLIING